jgi:hypothetical protein
LVQVTATSIAKRLITKVKQHPIKNMSTMSQTGQSKPNINLLARQLRKVDLVDKHVQPAVIRATDQSFSGIQNLSKQQAIVLFTPATPSNTNYDPYEPLGRAIHSHNRKVRHVPYSLKDGFTYVHEAHLADASVGAVVVVAVGGEHAKEQNKFAHSVLQRTNRMGGDALPAVKILIGKMPRKGLVGADGWDSAIRCVAHDPDQLKDTAALIFSAAIGSSQGIL